MVYPIMYRVLTIQGGAGFLPSTVCWDMSGHVGTHVGPASWHFHQWQFQPRQSRKSEEAGLSVCSLKLPCFGCTIKALPPTTTKFGVDSSLRTSQARHWRVCVNVFEGMLGQIGAIADGMSFAASGH